MEKPPDPSALEKAAAHPLSILAANALPAGAAFVPAVLLPAMTPLLALIPALTGIAAAGRVQARADAWREQVSDDLAAQQEELNRITDDQFKLISDCVEYAMRSTQVERLVFLRHAVNGTLALADVKSQEATALSRILRDLTGDEAAFALRNFGYGQICSYPSTAATELALSSDNKLMVNIGSPDGEALNGLASLGVLVSSGSGFDGVLMYEFSPVTAKLLVLLRGTAQP